MLGMKKIWIVSTLVSLAQLTITLPFWIALLHHGSTPLFSSASILVGGFISAFISCWYDLRKRGEERGRLGLGETISLMSATILCGLFFGLGSVTLFGYRMIFTGKVIAVLIFCLVSIWFACIIAATNRPELPNIKEKLAWIADVTMIPYGIGPIIGGLLILILKPSMLSMPRSVA